MRLILKPYLRGHPNVYFSRFSNVTFDEGSLKLYSRSFRGINITWSAERTNVSLSFNAFALRRSIYYAANNIENEITEHVDGPLFNSKLYTRFGIGAHGRQNTYVCRSSSCHTLTIVFHRIISMERCPW